MAKRPRPPLWRPCFFPGGTMKTIIYVDAFNLYYGCLRKTPHKWLDLTELARRNLQPHHEILAIKYFTAQVIPRSNDPDQAGRQRCYFRALSTVSNLEIVFGHFLQHEVTMPIANPLPSEPKSVRVTKIEEKGSDVNLACQLVHDAHKGGFECAVLITGDSDLAAPVRIVRDDLKLPVGVINPQKRPCVELKKHATFYRHIRKGSLPKSQFPNRMKDEDGEFSKPSRW